MVNDIISDALVRMQNAVSVGAETCSVLKKKSLVYVLKILKEEGFVQDFEVRDSDILVKIAYVDGKPVASTFKRISKPGQRIFVTYKDITPVMNGRGVGIISTSAGVMSSARAKARKLGGEYICKVW